MAKYPTSIKENGYAQELNRQIELFSVCVPFRGSCCLLYRMIGQI